MTPEEAAEAIKNTCNEISKETLKLNPAIRSLGNEDLQNELLQAVFKLTTDLEVIKKALRKKAGKINVIFSLEGTASSVPAQWQVPAKNALDGAGSTRLTTGRCPSFTASAKDDRIHVDTVSPPLVRPSPRYSRSCRPPRSASNCSCP